MSLMTKSFSLFPYLYSTKRQRLVPTHFLFAGQFSNAPVLLGRPKMYAENSDALGNTLKFFLHKYILAFQVPKNIAGAYLICR